MNASEFLAAARDQISVNPLDRLSEQTKDLVLNHKPNYDVHIHVFDKKCLSVGYVLLRMLRSKIGGVIGLESFVEDGSQKGAQKSIEQKEKVVYDQIISNPNQTDDWGNLENYIDHLDKAKALESGGLFGYNLKEALRVLKKESIAEVYKYYIENFSILNIQEFKNKPFISGVLMMDLEMGWKDMRPETKFHHQIDYFKALTATEPILPFFAVDPRRADLDGSDNNLYELFLKAFSGGTSFFGVKCYPSLGYLPSDNRLDPIFQICVEKNIPITTHCGGEVVSTYENHFVYQDSNGNENHFEIPGKDRVERAKFLNNPERWNEVLEKYPDLRINFAHFGGDTNWEKISKGETSPVIENLVNKMHQYENVYTDFSFNVVEDNLFSALNEKLTSDPIVKQKTLYGTDYWVVLPAGNLLEKEKLFLSHMSLHKRELLSSNPRKFLFGNLLPSLIA